MGFFQRFTPKRRHPETVNQDSRIVNRSLPNERSSGQKAADASRSWRTQGAASSLLRWSSLPFARMVVTSRIENRESATTVHDRGRSREDAVGDQMGRRYSDGSEHGQKYSRHARMDHPQFARAHRNGADLSGAREGWRPR